MKNGSLSSRRWHNSLPTPGPPLIAAIRKGQMYASSGVTLREVSYLSESGILEIEIVEEEA